MQTSINWESFATYNQDSRGIKYKFEDLCRQLFFNENLSWNKQFRYLHANPNNAGIETEPIYDELNNRWIGFQAKFFDNNVDYTQILGSANITIKNYKDKLNHVFLFCNKPLTNRSLESTRSLLLSVGISLELITDNTILDLVRTKYPHLGYYYFGNHTISPEWFLSHTRHMFEGLGERYNPDFNVETEFSKELSLFVHDEEAANYFNTKKDKLLNSISELRHYWGKDRIYLLALEEAVNNIPDVDTESLDDALNWKHIADSAVEEYVAEYNKAKEELSQSQNDQSNSSIEIGESSSEDKTKSKKEQGEINKKINKIDKLISLTRILDVSEREKNLLHGNILALYGKAGIGKSQMLASEISHLSEKNRMALLLIAGEYYTSDPVLDQIMRNLQLSYNFEDLIDILEAIGEKENYIVPVFIDALNETWNNNLWKSGLSRIIDKIKQCPMVRFVFSYRLEYSNQILSDSIQKSIENGEIISIVHKGFINNGVTAVKKFLDYYHIPFTPLNYFGYEMTNPLFLTLYCKTYNGESVSLSELYERLIKNVNAKLYIALEKDLKQKGYYEDDNLLAKFIAELAELFVSQEKKFISTNDLCGMSFWTKYGLTAPTFIAQLIKEQIMYKSVSDNEEYCFFSYDQMNDYYCAKAIISKYDNGSVRRYLSESVLGIKEGELEKPWNIDLFVYSCALYAEKYNEECISIIEELTDEEDKHTVFSRYLESFQWRTEKYIPSEENLMTLLKTYPLSPDDFWTVIIGNSVKETNPLNADFLHSLLSSYQLNRRDFLWTIYINDLPNDESNRIVQLVELYDQGETLKNTKDKQIELLLTLFGWLLSSSNRWLRDYTSKAMIEILKTHFQLCQVILTKFNDVNDPYIIQRLYGVVFGACCKRITSENECFRNLAEYVYEAIFNREKVYPDILLRDYARLIVERFLFENPEYKGCIVYDKIVPPYNSDPIPKIDDHHFLAKEYSGATFWLIHSMRFEGMGLYGDFGRYVFQSALRNFDINDKEIFNYAVYFIFNELGFSNDLFDEYDTRVGSFNRNSTAKTERIGKKYQWIAMYNILARVSDHCKMIDRWNYPQKESIRYEGAWEPYVRDFDPTLNKSFVHCPDAPFFKQFEEYATAAIIENQETEISTKEQQQKWLTNVGVFHQNLKDILWLRDDSGIEWIALSLYIDTDRNTIDENGLFVWSWLYAYFVKPEQTKRIINCADKGFRLLSSGPANHHESYSIFNREYPWAPSCRSFNETAWIDYSIKTDEKETVVEKVEVPDFSQLEDYLKGLGYSSEADEAFETTIEEALSEELADVSSDESTDDCNDSRLTIPFKEILQSKEVEKETEIGKILHANSTLLWEEEYDATKESTISRSVPCAEMVNDLKLKQLFSDGFFYDDNGKLAVFDTNLTQGTNCLVVRKDLLDRFLCENGLELIWLVDCEKEIHTSDIRVEQWSKWEAVYLYEEDGINGQLRYMHPTTI